MLYFILPLVSQMFYFDNGLCIDDIGSQMKIGTDAVCLAQECLVEGVQQVLDIGTGCGVVALLLAERITTPSFHIDAIDIDTSACEQAERNVNVSKWAEHITIWHTALQDFHPKKYYDLIVSNPPFFEPSGQTNNAHHTTTLPHSVLLTCCTRLLTPTGVCEIILPYEQVYDTLFLAQQVGLYPERIMRVYTDSMQRVPKRVIIRLTRQFKGGGFTIIERR